MPEARKEILTVRSRKVYCPVGDFLVLWCASDCPWPHPVPATLGNNSVDSSEAALLARFRSVVQVMLLSLRMFEKVVMPNPNYGAPCWRPNLALGR